MLKLNRAGKLARFYLVFGERDLPDDLCTFWWGLVWRVVKVGIAGLALLGFAILVCYAVFQILAGGWRHPRAAGLIVVGLTFTGLAIWKRRAFQFEVVREASAVVQAKVQAAKGRFCPRIDWQG